MRIFFFIILILLPLEISIAKDSSSFSPLPVKVQAESIIPIGTIIVWSTMSNPEDEESWLECNGASISRNDYPELVSLIGEKLPDYRGLFLRGYGAKIFNSQGFGSVQHSSGNLGEVQGDTTRNFTGSITNNTTNWGWVPFSGADGVFQLDGRARGGGGTRKGRWSFFKATFNPSRVVPTDKENRPINTSVRYLIRAK